MSLLDSALWDGRIYLSGWRPGRGGTGDAVEPATGETLGRYGVACLKPKGSTPTQDGTGPPHATIGEIAEFIAQ